MLGRDDKTREDRTEANPCDGDDVGDSPDSRRFLHVQKSKIRDNQISEANNVITTNQKKTRRESRFRRRERERDVESSGVRPECGCFDLPLSRYFV